MTITLKAWSANAGNALGRFLQSTSGKIGLFLAIAIILLALLAPVLHPYDPSTDRNYLTRLKPPSAQHWWGTDGLGRDVLILVWYGLRTSLSVGGKVARACHVS